MRENIIFLHFFSRDCGQYNGNGWALQQSAPRGPSSCYHAPVYWRMHQLCCCSWAADSNCCSLLAEWLHDRNANDAGAHRLLTRLSLRCALPTVRAIVLAFVLPWRREIIELSLVALLHCGRSMVFYAVLTQKRHSRRYIAWCSARAG